MKKTLKHIREENKIILEQASIHQTDAGRGLLSKGNSYLNKTVDAIKNSNPVNNFSSLASSYPSAASLNPRSFFGSENAGKSIINKGAGADEFRIEKWRKGAVDLYNKGKQSLDDIRAGRSSFGTGLQKVNTVLTGLKTSQDSGNLLSPFYQNFMQSKLNPNASKYVSPEKQMGEKLGNNPFSDPKKFAQNFASSMKNFNPSSKIRALSSGWSSAATSALKSASDISLNANKSYNSVNPVTREKEKDKMYINAIQGTLPSLGMMIGGDPGREVGTLASYGIGYVKDKYNDAMDDYRQRIEKTGLGSQSRRSTDTQNTQTTSSMMKTAPSSVGSQSKNMTSDQSSRGGAIGGAPTFNQKPQTFMSSIKSKVGLSEDKVKKGPWGYYPKEHKGTTGFKKAYKAARITIKDIKRSFPVADAIPIFALGPLADASTTGSIGLGTKLNVAAGLGLTGLVIGKKFKNYHNRLKRKKLMEHSTSVERRNLRLG